MNKTRFLVKCDSPSAYTQLATHANVSANVAVRRTPAEVGPLESWRPGGPASPCLFGRCFWVRIE